LANDATEIATIIAISDEIISDSESQNLTNEGARNKKEDKID